MNKKYTRTQLIKLIGELTSLRKGEGLVPSKLQTKLAIRGVAARLTHNQPDSVTNHQMYNLLLTELSQLPGTETARALRSAFGLTDKASRLSARRHSLAQEINKHPDTIERYENQAIADFAALLLEKEAVVLDMPASVGPSYTRLLEEQNTTLRQLANISLAAHLSLDTHSDDLLSYLESSRKPYLNATVTLAFLPSSRGSQWYRFKLTYNFQGMRDTYRIAVVLNNKDGERLMEAGLIDDFHQLNDPTRPALEISAIIANSKFILKNQSTNAQKLLRLSQLDSKTTSTALKAADTTFFMPCWLFEINIPPEWRVPGVTYEYQSIVNLKASEHYAYWYSPGLMFLRKLSFDFSHFPDADSWQFFLQPFLGHTSGTLIEEKRLFTLHANNWIMPGHGIALMWQEKHSSNPQT